MTDYSAARRKFVDWVKRSLIGEKLKEDKLIEASPFNRYTTGILYPMGAEEEADAEDTSSVDDAQGEVPAKKIKYKPPSSMGFSSF